MAEIAFLFLSKTFIAEFSCVLEYLSQRHFSGMNLIL